MLFTVPVGLVVSLLRQFDILKMSKLPHLEKLNDHWLFDENSCGEWWQ
jgi:hypothetical protein